MNPIVGIFKALGAYIIAAIAIIAFLHWWLDRPNDWPYLIPIIQGSVSCCAALTVLDDISDSEQKRVASFIVGAVIVALLLFGIYGDLLELDDSKDRAIGVLYLTAHSSVEDWINIFFGVIVMFHK